jgi:hypothetical protein
MLMPGQLQVDECPLRWITMDDLRAESLIGATPEGSGSNCPCHVQGDTERPGPVDQELWQRDSAHARLASLSTSDEDRSSDARQPYGNNLRLNVTSRGENV